VNPELIETHEKTSTCMTSEWKLQYAQHAEADTLGGKACESLHGATCESLHRP